MEKKMEERMEGVISVSTDIWGESVITSDNVEVLDKMSMYLYKTYVGFVDKTTFNRKEVNMKCWDKRNYIPKILSWCMNNGIGFNWSNK